MKIKLPSFTHTLIIAHILSNVFCAFFHAVFLMYVIFTYSCFQIYVLFYIDKRFIFILYLCVFARICICTKWIPGAWGRQKKALDFLELKLELSCGSKNWRGLCNDSKCSKTHELLFYLFIFETESHYVTLNDLDIIMQTMLILNL